MAGVLCARRKGEESDRAIAELRSCHAVNGSTSFSVVWEGIPGTEIVNITAFPDASLDGLFELAKRKGWDLCVPEYKEWLSKSKSLSLEKKVCERAQCASHARFLHLPL